MCAALQRTQAADASLWAQDTELKSYKVLSQTGCDTWLAYCLPGSVRAVKRSDSCADVAAGAMRCPKQLCTAREACNEGQQTQPLMMLVHRTYVHIPSRATDFERMSKQKAAWTGSQRYAVSSVHPDNNMLAQVRPSWSCTCCSAGMVASCSNAHKSLCHDAA